MIPEFYTRETFADYLQFEILLETASDFGWDSYPEFYNPLVEPTHEWDTISASVTNPKQGDAFVFFHVAATSATHTVLPTLMAIPSGTKMNVGGTVRTTSGAVLKGATSITFTGSFAVTLGAIGFFYNPDSFIRVQHPQYDAIIDATLLRLDVDNIETLTSEEAIRKLRLFGRREAWAAVMQNTSGHYSYSTIDGAVNRIDVYVSAKKNFLFEDERIRQMYGESQQSVSLSNVLAVSEQSKIKVRW